MSELEAIIRKHALRNAFDFGKASAGAVAGKVIGEFPESKNDMKGTMKLISRAIGEISKLSKNEIETEMGKFEYAKKAEKEKTLELPNAIMGNVTTRFPPEPSGYPHIGHAKAAFLNFESAKAYEGKMILRFDDTNPEKESLEYVNAIKEGLSWLGIRWDRESYTSDHMEEIYETARKLIEAGKAYVCVAEQEEISKMRASGREVECRGLSAKENVGRWEQMLDGKLKAVLLYKGNLESKNTVMHDPALARIIEAEHYRQGRKYLVWPGYDLAVAVMDHIEGLTHPMRSKEYELRNELYGALFADLGWKKPELVEFSRLQIKNAPISKRLLAPLVQEGKVMGWDDPRLPTLAGLKRRGIVPEAIKNFVLSFGLSKVESEPDWGMLLKENKKLIDQSSAHFFFVRDPVEVEISGSEPRKAVLRKHPKEDLGSREIEVGNRIFISRKDADSLEKGDEIRLKDLFNVKILEAEGGKLKALFSGDKMVEKKIQWVPDNGIECRILIPGDLLKDGEFDPESMQVAGGLCEPACAGLEAGQIIQFERFGFCRLDAKDKNKVVFIYSC